MENAKSFSDVSLDQFVQDFSQGALLKWSGDTNLLSIAKKAISFVESIQDPEETCCAHPKAHKFGASASVCNLVTYGLY